MDENTNNVEVVEETTPTTTESPAVETKTFTQEELDSVVKTRLAKSEKSIYSKLGINGKEELDTIVAKLQEYEGLKSSNTDLLNENTALKSEKAKSQYLRVIEKANVDDEVVDLVYAKVSPEKNEDLETYSKRVDEYLKNHTNFIKQATIVNTSVNLNGRNTITNQNQKINDFLRG